MSESVPLSLLTACVDKAKSRPRAMPDVPCMPPPALARVLCTKAGGARSLSICDGKPAVSQLPLAYTPHTIWRAPRGH